MDKDKSIIERDEELATYKKSSLIAMLNKQLAEQKNYISILEQQLKQYKTNKRPPLATMHHLKNFS